MQVNRYKDFLTPWLSDVGFFNHLTDKSNESTHLHNLKALVAMLRNTLRNFLLPDT